MLDKTIKIILSILFFVCLLKMPYAYFQLVRVIALIGFLVLAYKSNLQGEQIMMLIYIGLAILFQPVFKIYLGRYIWNVVDVITGIALIATILITPKKTKV